MEMKQFVIRFTILLTFVASLLSCTNEYVSLVPEQEGSEFTLRLLQTKTVNDGYSTRWVKGDKVNVFHAEAGTDNFISDGAFEKQDWIKEVKIPDSVSKIGECAFERCEGMADESGFVIVRDSLQGYYGDSSVVVVPDGVATISNYAFAFNFNVSEIYIPDSVSYIGEDAFFGCDDITVHASANSYAAEYAEENYMGFVCE